MGPHHSHPSHSICQPPSIEGLWQCLSHQKYHHPSDMFQSATHGPQWTSSPGMVCAPAVRAPIIIAAITVATTANKTVRLIGATSLASQPPADCSYSSISGNPEKGKARKRFFEAAAFGQLDGAGAFSPHFFSRVILYLAGGSIYPSLRETAAFLRVR